MRSRGWGVVVAALFLIVGYAAWEWYLSPRARVIRVLASASDAAEEKDVERLVSFLAEDYRDFVHSGPDQIEDRLREGFERIDRLNVTMSSIDVEARGDEAAVRFDLVVVAIRGHERYVVLGTPFEPERLTATLVKRESRWKVVSVERGAPSDH